MITFNKFKSALMNICLYFTVINLIFFIKIANCTTNNNIQNEQEQAEIENLTYMINNYSKDLLEKIEEVKSTNTNKNETTIIKDEQLKISKITIFDSIFHKNDLPDLIQNFIGNKHEEYRQLILQTSEKIYETNNITVSYKNGNIKIDLLSSMLPEFEEIQKKSEESNKSVYCLLKSLELITKVCKKIEDDIKEENNLELKFKMILNHTILVYELCSVAIDILDKFEHKGATILQGIITRNITSYENEKSGIDEKLATVEERFKKNIYSEKEYKIECLKYNNLKIGYEELVIPYLKRLEKDLLQKDNDINEIRKIKYKLDGKMKLAESNLHFMKTFLIVIAIKKATDNMIDINNYIIDLNIQIPEIEDAEKYLRGGLSKVN